jgi:hypothetical protein
MQPESTGSGKKKTRVEEKTLSTKLFYLFCKQYNTVISNYQGKESKKIDFFYKEKKLVF